MADITGNLKCGIEIKKCSECTYKLRCDECTYKRDNKSVKKALRIIKEVCESNACAGCPLHEACKQNYFGGITPNGWDESVVIE